MQILWLSSKQANHPLLYYTLQFFYHQQRFVLLKLASEYRFQNSLLLLFLFLYQEPKNA